MLTVIDPSNGKVLREVHPETKVTLEQKLLAAQVTFDTWRRTSFAERAQLLRAVAAELRNDKDNLGLLMTEEMGKPVKEALAEVEKAAWCAEHYAQNAEAYLADEEIATDATLSLIRYQPLGPVLGILPWNAPVWLALRFLAPALMAGNTCLLKHDPHTPGCAQGLEVVFRKAGVPPGVMQPLLLETPAVEAVIRDRRIQAVSFTGSSRGGAAVAAIAASEIKKSVLELGGSDPAIVLADADLDAAADAIALSRIINAGQSCIAAKRILVEEPVFDAFKERLTQRLTKLKVGDPRRADTDVGPIARDDLRQELHRQISQTIAAGARCEFGGELPSGDGYFYPVTLLSDVKPGMTAYCEETFGPVAVLVRVNGEEEALQLANDTEYGLAASIWTETERGVRLAAEIQAGQVVVNGVVKTDPRLPSGGIKRSGFGRELGGHGIREFVNVKQLWIGPKRA